MLARKCCPMKIALKNITAADITDEHLTALFAAHCECRPLNLGRDENEHSHDCDTGILSDIQEARMLVPGCGAARRIASTNARNAALERCVEHWNHDLTSDIYAPLLTYACEHPQLSPCVGDEA